MFQQEQIKLCTVLIHILSSFFLASAFRLDDCNRPLGMQSGLIPDGAISARTSSKSDDFNPNLARLNHNSGAWCATKAPGDEDHGYLQVDFGRPKVITAVATQGRYDNGKGTEYMKTYIIKYKRKELPEFQLYKDFQDTEVLNGNNDTNTVVPNVLDSRIIASTVQLLPYSENPEVVCFRVEFYGCDYKDELKSYSIPEGTTIGGAIFKDRMYDGQRKNGFLSGGFGLLTDGNLGNNEPVLEAIRVRRADNWIAWSKNDHKNGTMLIFNFDPVKKIRRVDIFYNNVRCQDGLMFEKVHVYCTSDKKTISQAADEYQPVDERRDEVKQLTVAIECDASMVQVLLIPACDHIILSEISLSSDKPPEKDKKPNSKDEDKKPSKPDKPDEDNPKTGMVRDDHGSSNETGSATIIVASVVPCVLIVLAIVVLYLVWRNKYMKTGYYNVSHREENVEEPGNTKDPVEGNDDAKVAVEDSNPSNDPAASSNLLKAENDTPV